MAAEPPLTHVVLAAASVADDLGYVALADLAGVLGSSTYRIIGGHMVTALVARWQLGAELYRETGDADLGVPPVVVREEGVIGRLLERGYEQVEGSRFARPVDDVPVNVRDAEGPRSAVIDVLVPSYRTRARSSDRVSDELVTTEVPGLALALQRPPVLLHMELRRLNGEQLDIEVAFPDEVAALTLKASVASPSTNDSGTAAALYATSRQRHRSTMSVGLSRTWDANAELTHQPHRLCLLLRAVPTRPRRPRPSLCRHDSILVPRSEASADPRVPLCLSSSDSVGFGGGSESLFVGDHEPPEMIGESPLQTPHGLVSGLALGDLLVEVAAADAVAHADLGDRDEMDRGVQLPVAAAGQPVACPLPGSDLDRRGTGVGRERVCGREPRWRAGAADQPDRSDWTDTIDLAQPGAMVVERVAHPLLDVGQADIDGAEVADEVLGEFLPGALAERDRPHRTQHRRRGAGGDRCRRPSGNEVAKHGMELVGHSNPSCSKVRAAFLEHREHRCAVLTRHRCRVALQGGDAGCGGGVDHIGLAAASPGELTYPGGRRGRHVHDSLVSSDEPLREVASQSACAFDRHRRCGNCSAQASSFR